MLVGKETKTSGLLAKAAAFTLPPPHQLQQSFFHQLLPRSQSVFLTDCHCALISIRDYSVCGCERLRSIITRSVHVPEIKDAVQLYQNSKGGVVGYQNRRLRILDEWQKLPKHVQSTYPHLVSCRVHPPRSDRP